MGIFGLIGGLMLSGSRIDTAGNEMNSTYMASQDAARAASKADQVIRLQKLLEANLAKSMMINEALWEIIRDKLQLTEQDLYEKLNEIDMRDGQLDGKNQRKVVECPSCGHSVSARHAACIYCGKIIDESVFTLS